MAGLSLRDRVRSSAIREGLRVEPLLLHIERSQLRWFGHLTRMPPGRLLGEVFRACPTGRRPRGRPRTRWRDYISRLAWERLGVPPDKLEEVAGEREVWASLLGEMDGWAFCRSFCRTLASFILFIFAQSSRYRPSPSFVTSGLKKQRW